MNQRTLRWALVALLALLTPTAHANDGVRAEEGWSRPAIAGGVGLGALTLRGGDAADRLLGAESPAARAVDLHTTVADGALMHMRPLPGLEVPAGGTVVLGLGGPHLMLVGLTAPLREGDRVPLTLRFERAGPVAVVLVVRSMRDRGR